jgi:hypothetical protein
VERRPVSFSNVGTAGNQAIQTDLPIMATVARSKVTTAMRFKRRSTRYRSALGASGSWRRQLTAGISNRGAAQLWASGVVLQAWATV